MNDLQAAQQAVRDAAQTACAAEGTPRAPEASRAYFAAWVRLLNFYHPLPNGITPFVGMPPDLAAMAKGLFDHFARGIIPGFVSLVAAGSGRDRVGPDEESDIRTAVSYVEAAKKGAIDDGAPIKTVGDRFKVGRSTVQGWVKNYKPATFVSEETMLQSFEVAGDNYRRAGRSHSALVKRKDARIKQPFAVQ